MNNIQRARNIVTCPVDVEITIRDAHGTTLAVGCDLPVA
jgi:hypothetical protein